MQLFRFFSIILHAIIKFLGKNYTMKKNFIVLAMTLASLNAFAQSGTNSPYSQYGLGVLSDQGNGFNRGMNGVGIALTRHNQVNYLNPASYSKTDSLSFIFDVGMSLQTTNFKEGKVSKNANNADFEYAVGAFRIAKNFGFGFGIIPFSNVGYNYSATKPINDEAGIATTSTFTNTYSGSGGIRQVFIGLGYEPIKGLSFGVNGGYIWGDYTRSMTTTYSNNSTTTLAKIYSADITNYKLDFGVQYSYPLNNKDALTLGVTYGVGHDLHSDPSLMVISANTSTAVTDTTSYVANNAISLPTQIGVGVSYVHNNKWTIAADYTLQKWSEAKYPKYTDKNNVITYEGAKGMMSDRHKINIGGEYCKNTESRSFISRIRYRFGASYSTPYIKINGQDGPKEISVSAGIGVPVMNGYNNRSVINVSAQWVNLSGAPIKENTFRINVGITFNEKWFAKWKFD